MASRLVLQQLGRRAGAAIGSPATTASGSGLPAAARAFSTAGPTNGATVASNAQDLGHYTGARARTSQFREIAKLKKDVNNIDIALSYMARRLLQGDALRHPEPAAASSERVLDALGLGAFYGFLGGFMFHFGISKSLLTDNGATTSSRGRTVRWVTADTYI